jgi:hypothetical protein
MAQKFKGFTPQQNATLLQKLGYTGPADQTQMDAFLAANPAAAARMGRYTDAASRKIAGQKPIMSAPPSTQGRAFATGGTVTAQQQEMQEGQRDLMVGAFTDPSSVITPTEVSDIQTAPNQFVAPGTGQAAATAPVQATTVTGTATAPMPTTQAAETYQADTATPEVRQALTGVTGETGTVSQEALVQGQTQDPTTMSSLQLEAAQIAQAQQIVAPPPRTLEEGETITGSAVDMQRVNDITNIQAAQGEPSKAATVQGQLEDLMQQFEGGKSPAWAAGAMRAATAALSARGLGASSMAGQAIIQATMEAAMPIAMADAQTRASFESQNLTNRQQAAMLGAEQRARFLEMDFDQGFQTRVLNAAKISDIANMNFTAEQQIALENARLAQSVDLANLDARNAKVLADSSSGILISDTDRLIALIGVEDIIVVDTPDALLVTTKEHAQRVKSLVDALKATGHSEVL